MGILIKDKVYELPDEGVQTVVITEVQDKGLVETNFGTKDRVTIVFETEQKDSVTGEPIRLFMSATKSLHPKSTLGNLINQLGVHVAPGGEFDVEDLTGIKAQVVVEHREGSNGKTYANIVSVLKRKV